MGTEEKIRLVKLKIKDSLIGILPNQKILSSEFALSESTLKRHFKAVYGKTMYDYYLEKKMELAKWLLQEGDINVQQLAHKLDSISA